MISVTDIKSDAVKAINLNEIKEVLGILYYDGAASKVQDK
ncbi:hypothetical protein J3D61_003345 [Bacillus cereus]|nr:hypothetical protein [Bacillus cereus]